MPIGAFSLGPIAARLDDLGAGCHRPRPSASFWSAHAPPSKPPRLAPTRPVGGFGRAAAPKMRRVSWSPSFCRFR